MADTQQDTSPGSAPLVDPGHGNSVAAWTAVGIMMLGSLVMSIAVGVTSLWLFVVGAVVVVAGAVVGKVLSAMGMGATDHSQEH